MQDIMGDLVALSRYLGDPSRTCAILGEGNTSARVDGDTFLVKASGTTLAGIAETGFVRVSLSRLVRLLEDPEATDDTVTTAFQEALVEQGETRRPSVEAMLHAYLLQYPEYRFIGHTHPTHVCMLLCSPRAEEFATRRIYPDHVVCMGRSSVFVPYVDPGLVLAREVQQRFEAFVKREGELPRAICMENHGLIAMGATPEAVKSCTDMAEKAAQVIVGACSAGGPRYMTGSDVDRIHTRPDEKYRIQTIART